MAEQPKCPKCGGINVTTYNNHRGRKVGKCHNKECKFWGDFGKAEEEQAKEAKRLHREKKASRRKGGKPKVESPAPGNRRAAPVVRSQPSSARSKQTAPAGPKPYNPEPDKKRWWDRDIF